MMIDPAAAALDGATNDSGPVRRFMDELRRKAETSGAGVLVVAHDTKSARNEAKAGGDPGAGAVAGSAAWFDACRGVLYLRPDPVDRDRWLLECTKANYGRTGWGALLIKAKTRREVLRLLGVGTGPERGQSRRPESGLEEPGERNPEAGKNPTRPAAKTRRRGKGILTDGRAYPIYGPDNPGDFRGGGPLVLA